jgi:hypothetical protein
VLGYDSPTSLEAGNLAWHFAMGLNSASVESVMVAGKFIIENKRSTLDESSLYQQARRASERLWLKLR